MIYDCFLYVNESYQSNIHECVRCLILREAIYAIYDYYETIMDANLRETQALV